MVISTDKSKQQRLLIQNGAEKMTGRPEATGQTGTAAQVESPEIGGLLVIQSLNMAAARRLVVLVPNQDVDEVAFAHEVWNLAFPPGLAVLLLGLCLNPNDEPRARRRLVTMAALIREPRVPVEMQLDFGRNWKPSLKDVLDSGDIVICPADQRVGIFGEPLDLSLAKLGSPTITLPGLYPVTRKLIPRFIHESVFWAVSGAVLFVFFWLQGRILRLSEEWVKDTLLSLSVLLELGLIWVWNNLSQ
ncbi:MAG TPA: hypothetical protein VN653_15000 [Anaerolineales bacterium]|nr:hypothetical protein [Anaerolineales bacterium]